MLDFWVFLKLVYRSHSGILFKYLSKTVLEFSQIFSKFHYLLHNFFTIIQSYPIISLKLLTEVWNLTEISEKLFSNFCKFISKCLENFFKISGKLFSRFQVLRKIHINARFFTPHNALADVMRVVFGQT